MHLGTVLKFTHQFTKITFTLPFKRTFIVSSHDLDERKFETNFA